MMASCREEVSGWGSLSESERQYIRTRARQECIANSTYNFNRFLSMSSGNFTSFVRGKQWKITQKKKVDTTETTLDESYLAVWKVTASAIYLVWTNNKFTPAAIKFIKITDINNEEMINDLKWKKCAKRDDYLVADGESNLTVTLDPVYTTVSSTEKHENTYSYKFDYSVLAYMGIFQESRTKKVLDNAGTVKSTEVFTTTMSTTSDASLPAVYSGFTNTEYCVIKYSDPEAPNTENEYLFPYNNTNNMRCSNLAATGLDANGDGQIDFMPASEL